MFDNIQEEQKTAIAPQNNVPYNFNGIKQQNLNYEPKDIFDEISNDVNEKIEEDYPNQPPNSELASRFGNNKNHVYNEEEIGELSYKKNNKIKTLSIIIIVFLSAIGSAWLAYIYFIKNFGSGNIIKKDNIYNVKTVDNINNSPAFIDNNNQDLNKDNNTPAVSSIEITKPVDTDKDGLMDNDEIKFGTDPKLIDTDGDGLTDMEEVIKYKTNPRNSDSDRDSYKDGEEIKNGYNPNGAGKLIDRVELP